MRRRKPAEVSWCIRSLPTACCSTKVSKAVWCLPAAGVRWSPTASYNWEISIYGTPHSGDYAANVEYDDKAQDEWLLSPSLNLTQGVLSFWSEGSVYYCRDYYDNCDLKVWIVVGAVGGGDDIYLGKADDSLACQLDLGSKHI